MAGHPGRTLLRPPPAEAEVGLPPGHLPQASRSQWEPPKGSKLQRAARSSPHHSSAQPSRTPGLALAQAGLHLGQGGQSLTGKPAGL